MRAVKVSFLATLVAIGAFSVRTAFATSPYTIGLDLNENMEGDLDTYTPTDNDPLNDPNLAGLPPGATSADPGLPFGSPGEDWGEVRNGAGSGVIEEVPSGFNGVATADGSGHFAIVQFDGGDGPFGRENRDRFNKQSTGYYGPNGYMATMDLYIDPSIPYGGPDGIPDFWWNAAVNGDATSAIPNSYATEWSSQYTVNANGTWHIDLNGAGSIDVAAGQWVGIEIEPVPSTVNPGFIAARMRVTDGTHTNILLDVEVQDYTYPNVLANYSQLTGPRYTWYVFPDGDVPYVYSDNVGWVGGRTLDVPEPSTMILAGMGALGLVLVAKRRRNG